MKVIALISGIVFLTGCSSIRNSPKYQLGNGNYDYKQPGKPYQKVTVYIKEDTVNIFTEEKPETPISTDNSQDQIFLKRSFDVDVMTVGFKYRPSSSALPRQLTTDFNGNAFIGYRFDKFKITVKKTPVGLIKRHSHKGITFGIFSGLGSTAISPWTTNNQTGDEYNGFVLSRGFAVMLGLNTLTVGLGTGWDYLTDRDKNIWIYQNTPWYGLTLGLNLN
jgi:hypothetical protein